MRHRQPDSGNVEYADEHDIDDNPKADIPLVFDADSSQHSALIDVLDGKNRVIEGPPGTGKSQTITNLIAAALHAGKKVLFVSEKLAALEVVKTRLTRAGLDPFVLELHSNKTNKKRVLEDIATRIDMTAPRQQELPELLSRQEEKRKELKAYTELMKMPVGNALGLTLHQVMWRAELHRLRSGEAAAAVQRLDYPAASRSTASQFADIRDRLRYLSSQLAPVGSYNDSHPLWGFFPTEFKPEDDRPVQQLLEDHAERFAQFAAVAQRTEQLLGLGNASFTAPQTERHVEALARLAPVAAGNADYLLLPTLFSSADPEARAAELVLGDLRTRQQAIREAEAETQRCLLPHVQIDDAAGDAARKTYLELKVVGLATLGSEALEGAAATLQKAQVAAHQSLTTLGSFSQLAGLAFGGMPTEVQRLRALADGLAGVPARLLQLRHPRMEAPETAVALKQARESLHKLRTERARFDEVMYTDFLPDEDELKSAILTLREGDAWYRVFQGAWRKAVTLHRRLERTKSRRPGSARLAELEVLLQHLRARQAWATSDELKVAAGPHFAGEKTPLADLETCTRWVQDASAALEKANLGRGVFDVLGLDKDSILRLSGQAQAVQTAVQTLNELESSAHQLFVNALPRALRDLQHPQWTHRLHAWQVANGHVEMGLSLMRAAVRPGIAAGHGLRALCTLDDLPVHRNELDQHEDGRRMFGTRFAGCRSNFEPAFAALAFGRAVQQAQLPRAVERLLLSNACVANHAQLTSCLEGLHQGWQTERGFGLALGTFGRFEPATWCTPRDLSTPDYTHALATKTRRAASNVSGLMPWAQYVAARKHVTDLGLEGFVDCFEKGSIPAEKLENTFVYRFYASVAQAAFEKSPVLRQFSGLRHSAVRKDYAALDREVIELRGQQIAHESRRRSSPPTGQHGIRVDDKTEMRLLEHLIPQQRPRVPVRQLLRRAGLAIQELKPVFMMGPQAVAQFLEPGRLHFDIVVMDEASQLRPEQAIGAVARGTQLVVVGDPKQLPPTSFFSKNGSAADGDGDGDGLGPTVAAEAESILDVCMSHFQPVRTLSWHYRSRHHSLIAFSNEHFYRRKLVVFPSPYPKSKSLGLRYHYVADGVYENQMNEVEARRVADAVVEHILHRPDDSLGVVTLNIKQRDLLSELVDERLRSLPQAAEFHEKWAQEGMDLFIKNLENVQGDERDCIIISTTFGRPAGAKVVRQTFGPITREGGWRRLNVLFTRARKSVVVLSSMRPEDIVVDSQTPAGTRALRNYLEFARTGVMPVELETGLPPDSDFEVAVMDILRSKNYEVTPQLGVAGFRIDIGVKHPIHRSGYLAAIECDGASYHTGVSVRDRDRIRQEILESLGWKGRIWRIWSTDWFRNPLAETERLLRFLAELEKQPVPDEYVALEPEALPPEETPDTQPESAQVVIPAQASTSPSKDGAKQLVFEDFDGALEIQVGDLVSYAPVQALEQEITISITSRQTNPEMGLVAEHTPLGSVLMGASVGDTVVLRVPGKQPQSFRIQQVKRKPAQEELGL